MTNPVGGDDYTVLVMHPITLRAVNDAIDAHAAVLAGMGASEHATLVAYPLMPIGQIVGMDQDFYEHEWKERAAEQLREFGLDGDTEAPVE